MNMRPISASTVKEFTVFAGQEIEIHDKERDARRDRWD